MKLHTFLWYAGIGSLTIATMALAATVMNSEKLSCMKAATLRQADAEIVAQGDYFQSYEQALSERRGGLNSAWSIANDSERRESLKQIEKTFKENIKNTKRQLGERLKAARSQFNSDKKACQSVTPPALCTEEECGIAPGMPNWICPDGSVGGPSCVRKSNGSCGYVIRQCPGSTSSRSCTPQGSCNTREDCPANTICGGQPSHLFCYPVGCPVPR